MEFLDPGEFIGMDELEGGPADELLGLVAWGRGGEEGRAGSERDAPRSSLTESLMYIHLAWTVEGGPGGI